MSCEEKLGNYLPKVIVKIIYYWVYRYEWAERMLHVICKYNLHFQVGVYDVLYNRQTYRYIGTVETSMNFYTPGRRATICNLYTGLYTSSLPKRWWFSEHQLTKNVHYRWFEYPQFQ